ncbi:MAG: RAMP superfamily CRISPR-associated protein [Candidatus Hadarchaeales archaeon]
MIEFRVEARPLGLFTVGGGAVEVFGPDVPFIKERGKIFIPGSTFKGLLRSAASRVAQMYGFSCCGGIRPEELCGSCDVCKLFGSVNSQGKVIVGNLEAVGHTLLWLTRVRIDDESNKAEEGGLFTQEHSSGGSFSGRIRVMEDVRGLGLLLLALAELRTGRAGRKSLLDVRISETAGLREKVEERWRKLVDGLEKFLWEGKI